MNRLLRHIAYLSAIAACLFFSGLGWYSTFTPGQSPWLFLTGGLAFGLAAVVLTFLWRFGSV
jgi:hypothetical protein